MLSESTAAVLPRNYPEPHPLANHADPTSSNPPGQSFPRVALSAGEARRVEIDSSEVRLRRELVIPKAHVLVSGAHQLDVRRVNRRNQNLEVVAE